MEEEEEKAKYTEDQLEEKEYLEREIRRIFFRDKISNRQASRGKDLLKRWKILVQWEECTIPFIIEEPNIYESKSD